ncbi:MAG: hypothetical protein OEY07_21260, partial [Gammaproteobacteria bacterium]|nr:hypothetical protein [Gammaproteobacteria bacterium]
RYLRMTEGSGLDPAVSAEERQLLLARSRLGISTPPDTPPARPPRPERGHDTSRLSLGGGRVEDQSFLHLGWRAAYHDFLDPTAGFTLHNRIEVFKLGFRYEQQAEAMEFDELQLLDITSLTPRDVFFKDISWHLRAGWLNRLQQDGGREKVFSLSGGGGLAWAFEWPQQTILYGFADIAVNFADIYMKGRLDQWGGSAGLLMQINPVWKLHLSGSELHDSRDRLPVERRITLEQGFRLGRDLALRLSVSRISWLVHESSPGRASDEAVLSLHFYH